MKYLLLLSLFTIGCAGSKSIDKALDSERVSILNDFGFYNDFPYMFSEVELNKSYIATFDVHNPDMTNPIVIQTCSVEVIIDGDEHDGYIRTGQATTVWIEPGLMTTRTCEVVYSNMVVKYTTDKGGFVMNDDGINGENFYMDFPPKE
jgi:hypothetical protein